MRFTAFLPLVALLAACTEPDAEPDTEMTPLDLAAEEQSLMERSRQWSATVGRGDMEAALAYWAEDAVMLSPDLPMIEGREAIREYVTQAGQVPGFSISWEPISAHVSESGDMAYLIERNRVTVNDSTGTPIVFRGKVVTVWRRGDDGVWLNVVDAWNWAGPPERGGDADGDADQP